MPVSTRRDVSCWTQVRPRGGGWKSRCVISAIGIRPCDSPPRAALRARGFPELAAPHLGPTEPLLAPTGPHLVPT